MVERQNILNEISRLSAELGRTPGKITFANETGIRESDWLGVHWARWGDAVREAGLEGNNLQGRSDEAELILCLYQIASEFGRMPTEAEQRLYSKQHPKFPNRNTFRNVLGDKGQMTRRLRDWLLMERSDDPLLDVLEVEDNVGRPELVRDGKFGWVYLLRSGDFFKIGRSDQIERRVKEVTIAMPEKVELEHAIKTDDPVGIETYWHRRFADRRANGEWFKLSFADVRAFKLRKFQ